LLADSQKRGDQETRVGSDSGMSDLGRICVSYKRYKAKRGGGDLIPLLRGEKEPGGGRGNKNSEKEKAKEKMLVSTE